MRTTLSLLSLLALLGAAAPASAQSPERPWSGDSIIRNPEWQKRFLGSYGFLSGAEPQVRPDELELLREVIDLMKVNTRAAAAMLEQQLGADSSAAVDFILANLHFQDGEHEKAIEAYGGALGKFPDFRRAHKNLGLLRVQRGEFELALEHLTRAVELGDRDGRSLGLIGYCYINLENPLAAEAAYRSAILQQPAVRDWKLGLARALLEMRKYEESAALFGSLIDADPSDTASWLLQANALVGLEKPMAAAVNLEAVRVMGKAQSSSLVLLGDIYMNAGMTELASDAYLEVVRGDAGAAQYPTAYRAASLLVRAGAHAEAEELLASIQQRYAGELSKDDELELLTLEAKVARARGREKAAAELLRSIVERDGTRGEALLELARYHQGRGDRERALLMIERAEKLEDFEYPALLEHAQILVADRDYMRAAELLRRALRIRSEPRVQAFLERVEAAARS